MQRRRLCRAASGREKIGLGLCASRVHARRRRAVRAREQKQATAWWVRREREGLASEGMGRENKIAF